MIKLTIPRTLQLLVLTGFSLFTFGLSGCAHTVDNILALDKVHEKQAPLSDAGNIIEMTISTEYDSNSVLDIQFLAVGGFAFVVDGKKIITSPSYSNPAFLSNLPWVSVTSNPAKIEKLFPDYLRDDFDINDINVKAIIVGHSHYDHLLDVPYLMQSILKDSKAYGSKTMSVTLEHFCFTRSDYTSQNEIDLDYSYQDERAIAIDARANEGWVIIDKNIRIYPIKSYHPPHFLGITFQGGSYDVDDKLEMNTAWDWRLGQVYSYLIDFLSDEEDGKVKVLHRLYYQDTATILDSNPTLDKELLARNVDIAIVTMAGSGHSRDKQFPSQIVNKLNAKAYIIGHWEDFFDNDFHYPEVARGTDENQFISYLESAIAPGVKWVMPTPGRKIRVINK